MDSKELFATLLRRLIQQSIFYVPNEEVDEKVRSMFNMPLDPYLGRLCYYSSKGSVKDLEVPKHFQKMLFKRQILDDTIFDISDLKDTVSKGKFELIISKYMLWLNACCFYSELILEELTSVFPKVSEIEQLAFKHQHYNFLEHRQSIIEVCDLKNLKPYSYEDVVLLSDASAINFSPKVSYDLSYEIVYEAPQEAIDNLYKTEAIYDNYAIEQFLLESVFNIPKE